MWKPLLVCLIPKSVFCENRILSNYHRPSNHASVPLSLPPQLVSLTPQGWRQMKKESFLFRARGITLLSPSAREALGAYQRIWKGPVRPFSTGTSNHSLTPRTEL